MSPRANLAAVLALIALLALAFPLLVSILSDWTSFSTPQLESSAARATTAPPTASPAPTVLPTATPTASSTSTPTFTPTATSTPTLTPTITPSPSPTSTDTPTATPFPRVYLLPFVQVFAVGQSQLSSSTQVLMYEGGADVFEVLTTQGTYTRLQTQDARVNLWTASGNVSPFQPPAAQYDYSVKGQTAKLTNESIFACAYNDRPTLAFGACEQLQHDSTAVLNARVTAGSTTLYVAQINGALYVIPASSVAVQ